MTIDPVRASEIAPTELRWLWSNRIPLPGLTAVQGEGGLGKGLIYAGIAAQLSRGTLPGSIVQPANSLIVSLEDEREILRTRLTAAGADLERIDIDDGNELDLLSDVEALVAYIRERQVRLLVLDPLHTIVRSFSHATRRALLAVIRLGTTAVVAINHFNSNTSEGARGRGLGGRGLQNLSRATHVLVPHPDDGEAQEGLRILAPVKINRGEKPHSLAGRVIVVDGAPVWQWIGETDYTADDLLVRRRSRPRATPQLDEARAFLRSILGNRSIAALDIERAAVGRGIAAITLRRAREALGVEVERVGFGPGSHVQWRLPLETPAGSDENPSINVVQSPSPIAGLAQTPAAQARPRLFVVPQASTPQGPSPQARPPTPARNAIDAHDPDVNTCEDDASMRFSLLELDLPKSPQPEGDDEAEAPVE